MSPRPNTRYKFACQPAATVVRALGGVRAAARALGVSAETPSQWNRPAARGGTGGFVPQRFWEPILALRPAGVTLDLLKTGRKERRVGALSRNKGATFERQVTNDLKALGHNARKIPLSGADSNYPGDVEVVDTPTGKWLLQCKIAKDGGGRQTVLDVLTQVVVARVEVGGAAFYAMRSAQFSTLILGRTTEVFNFPKIVLPRAATLLKHIEGHDALVFRKDGNSEWYAIVREEKWRSV
jgi:Holliday junction resolvase